MAISNREKDTINALLSAARRGKITALELEEKGSGKRAVVLCVYWDKKETNTVRFVPLASLLSPDSLEHYRPTDPDVREKSLDDDY